MLWASFDYEHSQEKSNLYISIRFVPESHRESRYEVGSLSTAGHSRLNQKPSNSNAIPPPNVILQRASRKVTYGDELRILRVKKP